MGGAIHTGGELIIFYAEFKNNIAADRGGALYGTYSAADKVARVIDIKEAIFEGNSAARGGAIAASATSDAEDSGAIFELGNVTFKNNTVFKTEQSTPTFIDNYDREGVKKNYNGNGAVAHLTAKCELHIYGTVVFEGNEAPSKGGALYLTNSSKVKTLEGSSVIFDGNKAATYGGAIYLTNGSTVSLENAQFIGNTAQNGGAIALLADSGATVYDFTASENTATSSGGFVYAELSSVKLASKNTQSKIVNNSALSSSAGAIYIEGSSLQLSGKTDTPLLIEGNASGAQGGVICSYVGTREITEGETTTTENVRSSIRASYVDFKSNKSNAPSQYGGGAIYASNSDVVIEKSSFTSNEAIYGGAISLYSGAEFRAVDTVFTNNVAKVNGGVMYTSKSNAIFENVTVNGNSATGYLKTETKVDEETGEETVTETYVNGVGGAFYFNSTSSATFSGVKASGNVADLGGFAASGYSVIVVYAKDNVITENKANQNGGAFYLVSDSTLALTSFEGTKNEAQNGGFIYASEATLLKISGTGNVISENVATSDSEQYGAGAIYIYKTATEINGTTFAKNTGNCGGAVGVRAATYVVFTGCTFTESSAKGTGGTFYLNTSTITLSSCTISGGAAGGNGGAIYSTTSTITTSNSRFTSNSSTGYGGVIYLTKSTYTSENDTFSKNSAKYGGAVAINSTSQFNVSGAEFAENTAGGNGGAIWVGSKSLTIIGSEISSNTAKLGGGIYISGENTVVNGMAVEISGNTATEDSTDGFGGGVYITDGAEVSFTDITLKNNKASHGGGIGMVSGALTINGILASGNQALGYTKDGALTSGNGGAINAGAGSLTLGLGQEITSNTFDGNTARAGGGAIYIYNTETAFVANELTLVDNEATTNYGGALYIRGASITVDIGTVTATANHAGSNGGAIYLYAFKGGKIGTLIANNNTTGTSGGALYIAGSAEVDITSLNGSGNTAKTDGGYAYIGTSTVKIHGGEIGDSNDQNGYSIHLAYKTSINTQSFKYPEGELFEKKSGYLVTITD